MRDIMRLNTNSEIKGYKCNTARKVKKEWLYKSLLAK